MSLFDDFIDLLYPRVCLACGNSLFSKEKIICTSCIYKLPKTNFHTEKENPLSKIFLGRINIESVAAYYLFKKGSKVQHLLHQFKYKGNREIGKFIGELYGHELKKTESFGSVDTIIPVPLHKKKEKKRGFNQSEYFAKGLSISMKNEINTKTLFREKMSETQTKKTKFKRWENVNNIFLIRNSENIKGKHILLVDDVITTGSTIEACAEALQQIPDIKISVAAIACTIN
jgi:ComF family protein